MKLINFVVLGAALLLPSFVNAAGDPALLHVRGEALLRVAADEATITFGVVTSGAEVEQVIAANSERSERLLQALRKHGVAEGELRTTGYRVAPQWSPRPKGASEGWQPRISGYRARNQLQLVTLRLQALPGWIQAAVEAGANQVGQLRFALAEPQRHYEQALRQATSSAAQQARIVADAAAVTLGELQRIEVQGGAPQPRLAMRAEAMAMRADAPPPPVEPGEVEVRASVSATYRIQN